MSRFSKLFLVLFSIYLDALLSCGKKLSHLSEALRQNWN